MQLVRLQIAQEFHSLVDLVILFWIMDEILKGEELRKGNIIQVFPSCPVRILFRFLKCTATPHPGFVFCVHNPAGTSPISKADETDCTSGFLLWLTSLCPCLFIVWGSTNRSQAAVTGPQVSWVLLGPTGQKFPHTEFSRPWAIWDRRSHFPDGRWQW